MSRRDWDRDPDRRARFGKRRVTLAPELVLGLCADPAEEHRRQTERFGGTRHDMIGGCQDSYRKRPGNRQMKGIQGPHRQVLELFQQVGRGHSVRIRERLDMKMASPDVIFECRPGIALMLDGDIAGASAADQQTTQLDG